MQPNTLIVPGFHGSEAAHWQTWFEQQLPASRRVQGIDWEQPIVRHWAQVLTNELEASTEPMWIVAHSFGCLASAVAAKTHSSKIAGALLVAPADPWRFAANGLASDLPAIQKHENIAHELPRQPFDFPSIVVASDNDPWVKLTIAAYWANQWGSELVHLSQAGHINVASGFGPWPFGLQLLHRLQAKPMRACG